VRRLIILAGTLPLPDSHPPELKPRGPAPLTGKEEEHRTAPSPTRRCQAAPDARRCGRGPREQRSLPRFPRHLQGSGPPRRSWSSEASPVAPASSNGEPARGGHPTGLATREDWRTSPACRPVLVRAGTGASPPRPAAAALPHTRARARDGDAAPVLLAIRGSAGLSYRAAALAVGDDSPLVVHGKPAGWRCGTPWPAHGTVVEAAWAGGPAPAET
jgi:hypothetical protein